MRSDNILLGRARYMRRCGRTCYSHEGALVCRWELICGLSALPLSGRFPGPGATAGAEPKSGAPSCNLAGAATFALASLNRTLREALENDC